MAAYQIAEDKEGCRLEHASVVPRPGQTGQLAFPQVDAQGVEEGAMALCLERSGPQAACRQGRCHERRVEGSTDHIVERQRLYQQYAGQDEQPLVAQAAYQRQDEAHQRIEHQYLGREERGVQVADEEEQHQPPAEAQAEITPAQTLVVVLDEVAEAEEQGKHGICLAAEEKEEPVPHGTVREGQPGILPRRVGEGVEVEVFNRMQQDDAHHCQSAQHVGHVHARMSLYLLFHRFVSVQRLFSVHSVISPADTDHG